MARQEALHPHVRLPDERVRLGPRWPTCSRASDGLDADRSSRRRRRHPVQHLLGAREGAGARVPRPRPRARAEGGATPTSSSASAAASRPRKARRSSRRAPYVDVVFGPQTLHRLPALIARAPRDRRAAGRHLFPEIEKFDHLPPPRVEGATRLRVDHGRLQQVLHVLRRAVHARRGSVAPVRRRADRDRRPRRPGRARSHAARPERQRLSRRRSARRAARSPTSRCCSSTSPTMPGIERIRYTTSHPLEMTRAADRRVRDARQARRRSCTCRCSRAPTACSPR